MVLALKHTPSFIVAPSYPITQMLNDQYLIMNPTKNNILLIYLGNYGSSYEVICNIPNPWTMILNPYYLRNLPFTFSNTTGLATYPFFNMVFIKILITRGSQGSKHV
jgi:hypothetical protein